MASSLTSIEMSPGRAAYDEPIVEALRPSEYTAALIQALRSRPSWVRNATALEIGCGSGAVLAALGTLGAAKLCGTDIECDAIVAAGALLCELDLDNRAELNEGDLWEPVAGRRFDLIAANLPHFPMAPHPFARRLPSWSSGGSDGRNLLDRFLRGLAAHLSPGGRAVMTHNAFVGLPRTRDIVAQSRLTLRVAHTSLVHISAEKLKLMTPDILHGEKGRSILCYGPYAFAEMHIVEIGEPAALA
ncbi:MAG TPA: methyltransferase [Stellaceae bacterium]|nr:methyltransferase [Stellaceae bacterium]